MVILGLKLQLEQYGQSKVWRTLENFFSLLLSIRERLICVNTELLKLHRNNMKYLYIMISIFWKL